MLKASTLFRGGALLLALLFSITTVQASQIYDNTSGSYTDDFSDNLGIPTRTKINNNSGLIQLENATDTTFNTPYANTGEVLTSAVVPVSVAKWGTVTVNASVPASTTVKMQVYIADIYGDPIIYSDSILPNNSLGFDITPGTQTINISALPPLIFGDFDENGKSLTLKIKLLFTTSDPLYTPTVDSLVVTWVPRQGDLASTTLAISDWPKSFANIANTLHIPSSNPAVYPSFEWKSQVRLGCLGPISGTIFENQLVAGDHICLDSLMRMYSIDMNSGLFNWSLPISAYPAKGFTIGNNGTAYITEYNTDTFRAIDLNNHNIKWTYNFLGGHGNNDVSIGDDGTIYTIRHSDQVKVTMYAFNPDGTVAWTQDIDTVSAPNNVYATHFAKSSGGILYFGTEVGDSSNFSTNLGKLYAFNPQTRTLLWTYNTGDIATPPVVGEDGTLYLGTRGAQYLYIPGTGLNYYGVNFSKKLYAINPDGTLKWQSDLATSTDIGYDKPLSLRSDGVILANLRHTVGPGDVTNEYVDNASTTIQAVDINTGSLIWSQNKLGAAIGLSDSKNNHYLTTLDQGITGHDWYLNLGYYNKTSSNIWSLKYPYNDANLTNGYSLNSGTSVGYFSTFISDSRGWLYGSLERYNDDPSLWSTQYFALSPWTLSVNINADTVSPGSQLSFSALSSMKQVNPLFGGNNAMQVVLDTGEKIPLLYNGLDGRGSTVWTASYTIPTDYKLGDHSYTLEASQTYLVTDIPTHFAATTTESNNTGITRTGTFKVQQAGILFTSTGGTGNTTVQNTAEVLFVTGTSTATTTPTVVTNTNPTPTVPTSSPYSIQEPLTRTLRYRTWGTDVEHLQTILAKDPNIYPEGLVTGYFGTLTRSAVQAVQNRWNIVTSSDAGYGIFGPKTLAKVREQWGW